MGNVKMQVETSIYTYISMHDTVYIRVCMREGERKGDEVKSYIDRHQAWN